MKKASELGLFVTESKGVVFLTQKELLTLKETGGVVIDLDGFVAASEQMGSFPLLVIEDEAEKAYYEDNDSKVYGEYEMPVYRAGYYKSKKTHPFTEEDLRKAMDFMYWFTQDVPDEYLEAEFGIKNTGNMNQKEAIDSFIQSLTKKELWIEVEEDSYQIKKGEDGYFAPYNETWIPKIKNNQLKAVWK